VRRLRRERLPASRAPWENARRSGAMPLHRLASDIPVLAEATNGPAELALLRRGSLKYMALADRPSGSENRLVSLGEQLYDLARDPRERRNLASARPTVAAAMRRELEMMLATARRDRRPPLFVTHSDPELQEKLKALGYLQRR
jgi:hypothetical protein